MLHLFQQKTRVWTVLASTRMQSLPSSPYKCVPLCCRLSSFRICLKIGINILQLFPVENHLYIAYVRPSALWLRYDRGIKRSNWIDLFLLSQNAYRVLVGKSEGRRPLERPRRKWVDNIKIDLREIGWEGLDWVSVAQDTDSCEHGDEPLGSTKCWEVLEWLHN
jgi:hypothetical protein